MRRPVIFHFSQASSDKSPKGLSAWSSNPVFHFLRLSAAAATVFYTRSRVPTRARITLIRRISWRPWWSPRAWYGQANDFSLFQTASTRAFDTCRKRAVGGDDSVRGNDFGSSNLPHTKKNEPNCSNCCCVKVVKRGTGERLLPSKDGGIRQTPPLPSRSFFCCAGVYSCKP